MHHKASALTRIFRPEPWRLAWLPALFIALAIATACEDKGIGRPCDLRADVIDGGVSATTGVYNSNATDCQSRICMKPAVQAGVATDLDTGPYCSAVCSSDSDCNGQTRDDSNPNDKRCKKGYTCALAFGAGQSIDVSGQPTNGTQPLCCVKVCLCKDFYSPAYGPGIPSECQPGASATCP
jgi:hypothetical protein